MLTARVAIVEQTAIAKRKGPMAVLRALVVISLCSGVTTANASADNPTFMMVSGISSSDELCLTAANGVGLDGAGFGLSCCARVCAQAL